ncbi:MAG: ABC transporter permease [Rubellimicrobium sp.]|nr:ABC transporter permease [Rubellimicrobium sp.]
MAIPLAAVVVISFQVRGAATGEWLEGAVPPAIATALRVVVLLYAVSIPLAFGLIVRRERAGRAVRFVLLALPLWIGALWLSYSYLATLGFGFGNYAAVFTDPINIRGVVRDGAWLPGLLPRSLFVSISVTLATVVLAYPIAYFISVRVAPESKSLWLFLITIPFWTSYLIRIFLWKVILGYSGVVNTALIGMGIIDEPATFILYNVNAVIITLAHAYAPFAILPIFVALEKIDRSLKEASRDLGEDRFTTFLRVTLPLSVPGIVAAVLIVFIPTIGDYVTPELVGGSGGLLIANRIQALFLQVNDPGLGAALSIVTMAAVGIVSLVFVFALRRWLKRA